MTAPLKPHWKVIFHDEFDAEFDELSNDAQDSLLQAALAVSLAGPKAGRPHVDTLVGSRHSNMKELRYTAGRGTQIWRAAFAFDPQRSAVILVAAEKQGAGERLFYKRLIRKADTRFDAHLAACSGEPRSKTGAKIDQGVTRQPPPQKSAPRKSSRKES